MNVVSLFAGCGGLDLGFERAGFKIIWANEFDESVHDTYRLNHPNTKLNTCDIRSLTGKDIPNCDGIIGGPPCQAWSVGGNRLGIADPRGQLFLDFIRIVNEKKPKFFVIENVRGILEEKHSKTLKGFIKLLNDGGYRIKYELINAADYKIPQDRFRVFFIGIRKDFKNRFEFPDVACGIPTTLRQAISDITEEPRFFTVETIENDHPSRMNHDVYDGSYDVKYMARNRVRSWDESSFTIQAQARNVPQHPQAPRMTFVSSSKRIFAKGYEHLYRRLSVRECARIQTFPDSFRFVYSDVTVGYKMIGNAVPPRLAYFLAIQIKKTFSGEFDCNVDQKKDYNKRISVKNISNLYPGIIKKNPSNYMRNKVDLTKTVLISLVKTDTAEYYTNQSARIYYTGKEFPSTIEFNDLYYFMPYIKGKGIRDLYYIKNARFGTKQEVHPKCNDNDLRIVFEIEFVKQLFLSYQPIHLNIWRTYTAKSMRYIMKIINCEEFG